MRRQVGRAALLAILLITGQSQAQSRWTWMIMDSAVEHSPPSQPQFIVTLGLKADSDHFAGSLGNCTLRGKVSGDLGDFDPSGPAVLDGPEGFALTVTDGPESADWQLNMVLDSGEGLAVNAAAVTVCRIAFSISNPAGRSGFYFSELQQTFQSDLMSATHVSYDSTGGDISLMPSGVKWEKQDPGDFSLFPNFPNPFNGVTELSYSILLACHVRLTVFNQAGQAIRHLINTLQPAGTYKTRWDAKDNYGNTVSSGIYILRLESDNQSVSRTLVHQK